MVDTDNQRRIKVKRRGNRLGFWFFETSLRLFGLRPAYGPLYFVCLHYALFDRQAVRAALSYIRRRFPDYGPVKRWIAVYRLFINQGKNLVDRHYLLSGQGDFEIQLHCPEETNKLLRDTSQGLILLTAHMGNWQVTMSCLKGFGRAVNLLMRPEDNPAVRDSLAVSKDGDMMKIVSPEQFLGGVVEIMTLLENGEMVSIMGDRCYDFNSVEVDFLGEPAHFPHGAFSIAAAAGCPVVVLLSAKTAPEKYAVDIATVIRPTYQKGLGKREQLQAWTQEFGSILENYVRRYAYQFFLFHDVWSDSRANTSPTQEK